MARYLYSLVRCVPDPRTGEFVNIGAIAGNPDSGDWSSRQVGNESRVRKLADATTLDAVHRFLSRVGIEIDQSQAAMEAGEPPLDLSWLEQLHHDHRNTVQLTPPTPIVATDAEQALEVIFKRLIIDPVTQQRQTGLTKHRVLSDVREAYRKADIASTLVRQRLDLFVGNYVHTPIDFAIANGRVVQLTQGWSFQLAGVDDLSVQVKSWAYALGELRRGQTARVVDNDDQPSTISPDVDLEVVVAGPKTPQQEHAFNEAIQVFDELGAKVNDLPAVESVGRRASELLNQHA